MIHIYVKKEELLHELTDEGSTCECIPRVRFLNNGDILCIHSPLDPTIKEMNDEFIDEVLSHTGDTDDNIEVEDV